MEIGGVMYRDKAKAGEALLAACNLCEGTQPKPLGSYRGFAMEISFDSFNVEFQVTLKGAMSHHVPLGTDARGNLLRIDNALAGIEQKLETARDRLVTLENQQQAASEELEKPFPQEAELAEKSARLAELDALLSMDGGPEEHETGERDESDLEKSGEDRPSVLADLKDKASRIAPENRTGRNPREEVL